MTKTKTRFLTVGLALIVLLAAAFFVIPSLGTTANAEAWNGNIARDFAGGTGSETDPHLIENGEQLALLAQNVNNGDPCNNKYYKLTADIDLGEKDWTPIGSNDVPFGGTFDGNGKTISNLNPIVNSDGVAGLFGYNGDGGTIKNVYLDNVNVVLTKGNGAALCAVNNYGATIENCAVLGGNFDVSNYKYAAAICYENKGKIDKCYNMANVTAASCAGIVFQNYSDGTVSNCYNAGEVSGIDALGEIGGICARNNGKIKFCLNYGELKNGKTVGGICASKYSGEGGGITSCYSNSDVCSAAAIGKDWDNSTTSDVGTMTTAELCRTLPSGFGSEWAAGVADVNSINSKLKAVSYTYPSLNGVTKSDLTATADIYNFGTDIAPNWLPVTIINDVDGLKAVNNNLSGNYVLGCDYLNLEGAEWTPIGSEGSPFTGKFSGNGYTIRNFKSSISRGGSAGLFGYNSGTIQEVYVDDFEVKTNGTGPAAGLCGVNNASGTIEGCATLGGSVSASNYYGGVGGVAGICANNSGTINRCYNMASVKTGLDGGGVVNGNLDGGTVSNCYNAGEVSTEGESGTVIGGISAQNWGKIEYCMNYGNVNNAVTVGGICGRNDDNKGTISSCYSDSSVCRADAVGNGSNKLTNVEELPTEELCTHIFCSEKLNLAWADGSYNISSSDSIFGVIEVCYPRPVGVGNEYRVTANVYNFKTSSDDDWQKYTEITTAEELAAINENLSGNYVLGIDYLDLAGEEWTPIGSAIMGGAFTGRFSGNGHTIKGVKVNVTDQYENAGLFGFSTGVIMNLAVEGDISGTNTVGGICGGNSAADDKGIIYACSFKGTVTGTGTNIGGICGYNFKGSATAGAKISNCFSYADVKGDKEVGGICGYNEGGSKVSITISACTVSGTKWVGAVCGKNEGDLVINYFDKTVSGDIAGAMDGDNNPLTSGTTGYSTADLCQYPVNGVYWNKGSYTISEPDGRFHTVIATYPSVKGVGSAYSTEIKEYNFSTNNYESWKTYTEISTAEEFIALGNDESKWGGNYVLTDNIDLSDKKVMPIGNDYGSAFTGNFSGDGHTISGVKIDSTGDNVGLFGYAGDNSGNRTTIMNLAVEGDITGKNDVGGICGYGNEYVNIFACSFKGSVSGKKHVGGICGGIDKSCYIENCFNSGTVSGESDVGGLLGYVGTSGGVNNSINVGKVIGTTSANPICGAVSDTLNAVNNYYNSDIFSGTDSNGTPKTTAELCDGSLPTGLKDSVWQAGEITRTTDAENTRMSVVNAKYPSLKGVGEPLSLDEVKQYNFKTNGDDDDWQEYTEINSAADLAKINDDLSGSYVLMKDITLGDFTPIGSQDAPFTGKFSGNGHTISGVKINATADGAGIFGVNNGTIMNLAVEGDITGSGNNVGGICGTNNGTIYACSFNGSVKGAEYVGGISGYNSSTGTITNCYAIGSVEATVDHAGGISSINDGSMAIRYCYFAGTAVAPDDYNPICNGSSPNCYYDRELFNINSNLSEAIATAKLCDSTKLPQYFDGDIWETGSFTVTSTEGKFRTVSYKYPRLKEGCAAYGVNDVKQYNFGMDGNDNWAQFNEINSLDDLNNINKNNHTNYVLMTDIDLNEGTFSPILPNSPFWGNFSGNGHTIKGDIVGNKPRNGDFTALFSNNSGLIINLAVKCDVSGTDLVGGICGRNNGTIYGCSFEGSVKGNKWVGGICGQMTGSYSHIINCYVIGSIEAATEAGGILGASSASSSVYDTPNIENCYFVGTVTVPDSGKKDAICSNQTDIIKNCYYNSELYTGSTVNGTGLSTVEMTSSDALGKMSGFDSSIWEKKTNKLVDSNNENGVAYYPSLIGSKYSPSVEFTAEITFERTDDKALTYKDDLETEFSAQVMFDNGVSVNDTDGEFSVYCGTEKRVDPTDISANKAVISIEESGEVTYTLHYTAASLSDFCAADLTKDLTVNVKKKALTADDLKFTAPTDLVFSGSEKSAVVIADPAKQLDGIGEITVKYFDNDGKEVDPIDAGEYTVKIDITEGDNCLAAENLTDSSWKFEITKAAAPTIPDNTINISWAAKGEKSIPAAGLPERMGKTSVTAAISGDDIIAANSAAYSDGKVLFTMGANSEADIGKTAEITFTFTTQNYNNFTYTVKVTLTAKGDQEAPGSDDFDLVFTNNGTDITAQIVTNLKGVEFSFDGINWSDVNSTSPDHNKMVTAYIRFAETDELNASPSASKTANSGHGEMVHHERVEPTCIAEGNIEYWECTLCDEYFLDKDAKTSTTLESTVLAKVEHKPLPAVRENEVPATCTVDGSYDEVIYCSVCHDELSRTPKVIPASGHSWSAKYESDKTGHWHKCENCDATTAVEEHISSGPATTQKAETCTECGYVIAPRKSSGGGGGGGGGSTPRPSTPSKPSINGSEKSWTDIAADLAKQNGGNVIISLNGETTVPADVIKAIADNKIKAEFIIDSTRSWLVDGAKITAVKAADFSILPGNANRSALRGAFGADMKISGTGIPADLKLTFRSTFAGQFANVYKLTDGALVFQGCFKVGNDGSVVISGAETAGEYVVMVCEFSDLPGDMTNDGVLNALDAAAILKDIVGTAKGANPLMGDFSGDGTVNALDASAILRKIVAA